MTNSENKVIAYFGSEDVRVSDLRLGDTIIYNDSLRTIGKGDVLFGGFMGTRIFGDASVKSIKKVNLWKWYVPIWKIPLIK